MKNLETLNSLLSKLSSVRATLSDDEQALLDELLLGAPDDVKGHLRMASDKDEFRAYADETEAHLRMASDKDEARGAFFAYETEAHLRMASDKDEARGALFAPDEAVAHIQQPGPLAPPWVEIYFDPDIEAYQIKHQS